MVFQYASKNHLDRTHTDLHALDRPMTLRPDIDAALVDEVEKALDTLRPYLRADGGEVRLLDITPDMVVELELLGACGTCPMSMMTLRAGIEQAVKRSVPSIARVEAVNAMAP